METLSFIFLFIIMITSNANATCTKGLEPNGKLESKKNRRGYYFNNRHQIWNKCTLTDHRFVIEIKHFDLERMWDGHCGDYLKITDKRKGKIVLNRCGFNKHIRVKSYSNEIQIEFHSDKFQSKKTGFKLTWWSEAINTFSKNRTKAVTTFQKETKAENYTKLLQTEIKVRTTTTEFDTISQSKMKDENREESLPSTESSTLPYERDQNTPTNSRPVAKELGTSVIISSTVPVSGNSISNTKADLENTSVDTTNVKFTHTQTDNEKGSTQSASGHGTNQGSPLYLLEMIIGGVLMEVVIVSLACSMYKRRGRKRWSVKTLSRTKNPSDIQQTWWKRPQSLAVCYNERISIGNIYNEINVQEMTSFSNTSTTVKEIETNRCPYIEVSCNDGEYDHLRKHREKRKSLLGKINEYGFHRISAIFKNN